MLQKEYPSFQRKFESNTFTIKLVDNLPQDVFVEIGPNLSILLNVKYFISLVARADSEFVLNSILMAVALHIYGQETENHVLRYFVKLRQYVDWSDYGQEHIYDSINSICKHLSV